MWALLSNEEIGYGKLDKCEMFHIKRTVRLSDEILRGALS